MMQDLEQTTVLLEHFPATLKALLGNLPDMLLQAREGEATWTPVEIVAHLIDSERHNWIPRARLILEVGEAQAFATYARNGHTTEVEGKTLAELLETFARLRAENLAALAAMQLTPEDLAKRGRHPAFGVVTLSELLATWAVHDMTHLHQLSRVLAAPYREAVGPWVAYLGVLKCGAHGD